MSRPAAFSALLLVAALPGVIAAPAAIAAPEPVPVSPEKSELWGLPHDPLAGGCGRAAAGSIPD